MRVANETSKIGGALDRLGGALKNSFTPKGWEAAAKASEQAAKAGAEAVPEVAAGGVGRILAAPFRGAGKAGIWLVEQPVALIMKPVKWSLNGVAATFEKFPRAAPVVAVGAALLSAGSWLSHRKSQNLEAQAIAQMQALEAQQAAQPSYMNSVSPAEMAAMNARMQAGGQAGAGHAASVEAARSQVPAPEAAGAAAAL
ncbi:MAG: hypothetical protein SFW64_01810 [Alphaproteobacteria bacterium]|nr:hypothetical protein [Alphaproteobacteria bacterium]